MGNQARGLPKLSMPDGRAFLAETVCTAGPAFSSFLFRLLRAPALMRSRQHLSYLIDPSASTESVKAGFHEPRIWAADSPTSLCRTSCQGMQRNNPVVGRGTDGLAAPVSASVMILSTTTSPLNLILNFGALGIPAAWSGLILVGPALSVRAEPEPTPSVRVGLAMASISAIYMHSISFSGLCPRRKAVTQCGRVPQSQTCTTPAPLAQDKILPRKGLRWPEVVNASKAQPMTAGPLQTRQCIPRHPLISGSGRQRL